MNKLSTATKFNMVLILYLTFLFSSMTIDLLSVFGTMLIACFSLEIKLLIINPMFKSRIFDNKYYKFRNLYNRQQINIDAFFVSIIIIVTSIVLVPSLPKFIQDRDWFNFDILTISFILFVSIVNLVHFLNTNKCETNLADNRNKSSGRVLKASLLLLAAMLMGVLITMLVQKTTSPKVDTIYYKGNKYYVTALLNPNLDSSSEQEGDPKFFEGKIIGQLSGRNQSVIWKLDSFPESELIVKSEGGKIITSYTTLTNKNLTNPKDALLFLEPEFLFYYNYSKNDSDIKYVDKKKQKKIIQCLAKSLSAPASHGYMDRKTHGTQLLNEIYLFKDSGQSLMMQLSIIEKENKNIYLTVTGNTRDEYWIADPKLIPLLK